MKYEVLEDIYDFYKKNYSTIEKHELYKWKAVKHFQENWDIDADNFYTMLDISLKKVSNLMSAGNYYPHRMILWAAQKEPDTVKEMFSDLYNLDKDIAVRINDFKDSMHGIIERNKEGTINKSYQDDRAIMVYLNLRYPEKYYLYKYRMLSDFNDLIDYVDMPPAGSIDLIFVFETLCEMIHKKVVTDKELLDLYEPRKNEYYDPEYHLLVQDIIYSAKYYATPEFLQPKAKAIETKKFTLKVVKKSVKLKPAHVDFVQKAVSQKNVGQAGEEFVYQYEREKVSKYKLPKTKQVRWVSKLDGDGLGYDILSFDKMGREIYIEVKATEGSENGTLFITANELEMSELYPEQYRLYRVYDLDVANLTGKISIREGSLKELCISAQTYKVDFN